MKKLILSILVGINFSLAHAGTAVSGGGGAFVCRPLANNPTYIERSLLVDLWESQNTPFAWPGGGFHGDQTIQIDKNNTPVPEQVVKALNNLRLFNSDLEKATRAELDVIMKVINPLPKGISLTIPNDLQTDYFPEGCAPEGMLRYNGYSKKLDVKTNIFEKLESNTDVAASYIHEALYKVFRDSFDQAQNSILVRRLVACVFSDECVAGSLKSDEQIYPDDVDVYSCVSNDLEISLISDPSDLQNWKYKIRRIKDIKFGVPANDIAQFTGLCYQDSDDVRCFSTEGPQGVVPFKSAVGGWFESFGYHPLQMQGLKLVRDVFFKPNGAAEYGKIRKITALNIYSGTYKNLPRLIAESVSANCVHQ